MSLCKITKLELNGATISSASYVSIENTGNSYNVKPLADNLDLTHLSNSCVGRDVFKSTLQTQIDKGTELTLRCSWPARLQMQAG